ncbi:MAG: nitroreductase [Thermoprotei archaeon]|nr:MAG: nitroreductase [Thermoprotei archaeon]RLE87462.1 MAG: nitroreductase [Thermoprotei archaeon]
MKIRELVLVVLVVTVIAVSLVTYLYYLQFKKEEVYGEEIVEVGKRILLPYPKLTGKISVEEAIANRRSVRSYEDKPITLEQLAQILWAAQGITEPRRRFRAAPSAGATYPLELYVVVGENTVKNLVAGVYRYDVHTHSLIIVKKGDIRRALARAALGQVWVEKAPLSIVITAIYGRTTSRYGERGIRYVHIEVGHVGQNIYLQSVALGLGTVAVGAFYDDQVRELIGASKEEQPLYIMPIGYPQNIYKLNPDELKRYYEIHRKG